MTKLKIYILPWLIMLVYCLLVLAMLSMVFDSGSMDRIWPLVTVGGIIASGCCNAFEYFVSRITK
jgi:hypothetical protein